MTAEEATDVYLERTIEVAIACIKDLLRGGLNRSALSGADEDNDENPSSSSSAASTLLPGRLHCCDIV